MLKANINGAYDLSIRQSCAGVGGGCIAIGTATLRDSSGSISGTFASNLYFAEAVAGTYDGTSVQIVLSDGSTLKSTSIYVNCADKLSIDGAVKNSPKLGSGTFQLVHH